MEERIPAIWRKPHNRFVFVAILLLFERTICVHIQWSISEEQNEGTLVGNIAKHLGIDHRILKERGLRIVSASAESRFRVNQDDGGLYVNEQIDREEICEGGNACLQNLKIVLEYPLEIHYISVHILDINDNAPNFIQKMKLLEIGELAVPGTRFQLQAAHDPDSGSNSVQSYKLSHNDHFRLDIKDREDGKIPILILQKQLDRETAQNIKLSLTAVDGGKPPRSGTMEIIVNVLDINDNAPVFTEEAYIVLLPENAPFGTTVIQVNATDLDVGSNGEIVYSIGNDVNNKLSELFEISPITGVIVVKGVLDFEAKDKYEVDIKASDKGLAPMTTEKTVTIKIVDVNDNTPEIEVTSFSSVIPEDSRSGTTVALISVSDLDSGVNGKVSCSIPEDLPFKLLSSSHDNIYSLVTSSPLDRETTAHYDITLFAKDEGNPQLSSLKTIIVHVSDVNDNSPEFNGSPYTFYVKENNAHGAFLFSVVAFDRDSDENAVIIYQICKDNLKENRYSSFINVNPDNGAIYALKTFDFETINRFKFHVLARDSGTPSQSSNVTVHVFILDENDNAPVILYPVSANGSAEDVEIPRNVNAGHFVTKVRAYDADIGYNGWLLFSLQEVSDHRLFGLDRYTGHIRTLRSFTETDEAEHKLVILVKDNGNVSLSATATLFIKVVEPKEAFASSDITNEVKHEEENDVTFYLIITLGSISFLFIISIIVLIVMQCSKTTDYSSKYLQDTNYDGTLCHSIQYRSGDKRYMLVGPRTSIGSHIVQGSNTNTLVISSLKRRPSAEVRQTYKEKCWRCAF